MAPAAPTDLSATPISGNQIKLSWNPPSDDGGAEITGYRIETSRHNIVWSPLDVNTENTETTYTHSNLKLGSTHYYRVSVINTKGAGTKSKVVKATTYSLPDAPTNLKTSASGSTMIDLSWQAPSNTGGATITAYQIEALKSGSGWYAVEQDTRSDTTGYTHKNLKPTTFLYYRVSAINSIGTGRPSLSVYGRSDPADEETVSVPDAPTGLTATASGSRTVDLSWGAPSDNGGASITGYQIEVSPNGTSGWKDLVSNADSDATQYSHHNLSPDTTRHYRVRAINSAGSGASSNVVSATTAPAVTVTVPDAPISLSAAPSGSTTINLSWNAPSNNGGASISGYQIEVSSNVRTGWIDLESNTNSGATGYSHTNLSPNTTHHYRVSAIKTAGSGVSSNVVSATTGSSTESLPSAPIQVSATASGSTTIVLSWSSPSDDGGAEIRGYRIEGSPNRSSEWTNIVADTGSKTTTYSDTNLSPNTTRYYRVSAINSVGTGDASSVVKRP